MSDDEMRAPVGGQEEEDEVLADTWELKASEEDELADYLKQLHDVDQMVLEMKDISELSIDLAYSSLLYDSEDIAQEVEELEEILDSLQKRLQRRALEALAAGTLEVDQALALIRLAQASEVISDAALDIADVVLRDVELHPVLAAVVRDSDVIITRGRIHPGSMLAGQTLGDATLESETGMRVIAIKRGALWIYGPDADTDLQENDVLVARGPDEGEKILHDVLEGKRQDWE